MQQPIEVADTPKAAYGKAIATAHSTQHVGHIPIVLQWAVLNPSLAFYTHGSGFGLEVKR